MQRIDSKTFGPWAVVTGASSGIGKEFARQLAASGLNVVLVARRLPLLEQIGHTLAQDYRIAYRTLALDLSQEGFLDRLIAATSDLDIGMVVSNAGMLNVGEFVHMDSAQLHAMIRLSVLAHMDLARHFGEQFSNRGRGGIILLSGMGASQGVPYAANDSAAKAYVLALGETLHDELKSHHVHVTVLLPGPTETPLFDKIGMDPQSMPIKPMTVEQCVSEGLAAFTANRSSHLTGVVNRFMNRWVPRARFREMNGKMLRRVMEHPQVSEVRPG